MPIKSAEAMVTSDKLPNGRVVLIKQHDEGTRGGECANCGTEFRYDHPGEFVIQKLACGGRCAKAMGFYNRVRKSLERERLAAEKAKAEPAVEPIPVSENTCQECNGKAKASGFSHTEKCSLSSKNKKAKKRGKRSLCPECKGPKRGRGFSHKNNCSKKKGVK
jgi:hypothetical protein